jgi:hypothetical protein
MHLKWSQTVQDDKFLAEMHLRNPWPEETKGKIWRKRRSGTRRKKRKRFEVSRYQVRWRTRAMESNTEEERFYCSICIHD